MLQALRGLGVKPQPRKKKPWFVGQLMVECLMARFFPGNGGIGVGPLDTLVSALR